MYAAAGDNTKILSKTTSLCFGKIHCSLRVAPLASTRYTVDYGYGWL